MKEQKGIVQGAMKTLSDMVDVVETNKEVVGKLPQEQLESVIKKFKEEYKLINLELTKAEQMVSNEVYHEGEAKDVSKLRLRYLKAQETFINTLLSTAQRSYNARFMN